MRHVSARLLVACFSVVVAVTPLVLITLLSQTMDDALNLVVPPWHQASLAAVATGLEGPLRRLRSDWTTAVANAAWRIETNATLQADVVACAAAQSAAVAAAMPLVFVPPNCTVVPWPQRQQAVALLLAAVEGASCVAACGAFRAAASMALRRAGRAFFALPAGVGLSGSNATAADTGLRWVLALAGHYDGGAASSNSSGAAVPLCSGGPLDDA